MRVSDEDIKNMISDHRATSESQWSPPDVREISRKYLAALQELVAYRERDRKAAVS